MADILQTPHFEMYFLERNVLCVDLNFTEFVFKGPVMTQFTDTHICHAAVE